MRLPQAKFLEIKKVAWRDTKKRMFYPHSRQDFLDQYRFTVKRLVGEEHNRRQQAFNEKMNLRDLILKGGAL